MTEQKCFKWQLQNSNLMYLGASVLVLLDVSYQSRFWTQLELWLSLQVGTSEGLQPASEDMQRAAVRPIHSATEEIASALVKMWQNKSHEEALETLRRPDVRCTNQSDKEDLLPKIALLNDEVRNVMQM